MTSDGIAQYSQPSFYRFSDDSTKMASYVAHAHPLACGQRILDLCAGCGVIGLEIISRSLVPLSLTSIECEREYIEHFYSNSKLLKNNPHRIEFFCSDFTCLSNDEYFRSFDLIVCNPPYFDTETNRVSTNPKKAKCRTINGDQRASLVAAVENSLAFNGVCYFLSRVGESLEADFRRSKYLDCRIVKRFGDVLLIKALLNKD